MKIKGPLFSETAHGAIAKNIIMTSRKGGQVARDYHQPKKTPTLNQRNLRTLAGLVINRWQTLTPSQKEYWNSISQQKKEKISGFNLFYRYAIRDPYQYLGLVLFHTYNENSGATVEDHSGNSLTGTLGPSYPTNAPSREPSFNEKYANAVYFSTSDHDCTITHNDKLNFSGDFSICFLLKTDFPESPIGLLTKMQSAIFFLYGYGITLENQQIKFYVSSTSYQYPHASAYLNENKWQNISAVFEDSIIKIYVDCKLGTTTGPVNPPKANTSNLRLTGADSTTPPTGKHYIDNFQIYNRALSLEEIILNSSLLKK